LDGNERLFIIFWGWGLAYIYGMIKGKEIWVGDIWREGIYANMVIIGLW